MNRDTLDAAIADAEKFLTYAHQLCQELDDEAGAYPGAKIRGQVRRASMDLTRSLADLRRPG